MILGIKKLTQFMPFTLNYPQFLFCGSFNPLHCGHIAIAKYVSRAYGPPVDFEISLSNVEKQHIDLQEAERRFQQMKNECEAQALVSTFGKLYITDAARYLEKARLFPDVTFVCGFDTIHALCAGIYYKGNEFNEALDEFEELGTKWLAFNRRKANGEFSREEDFENFPDKLRKHLTIVSKEDFPHIDVSSREIRHEKSDYRIS
jgi:nicotinic acid mononucleotide adenylyltransferase